MDFVTDLNVLRECKKSTYSEDDGQVKEIKIQMKYLNENACLFEKLPIESAQILQRLVANMESIVKQARFKEAEWNERINALTSAFH